jgi:16S rRNA (guanine966-N2)-methyltransferase
MRIIAGQYRGRRIATVKDHSVRPATDRVRETIFNVLVHRMDIQGTRVLDLFAGSGSLGLEALSRGAAHATFVEQSAAAITHLERNIQALGCEAATELAAVDAISFLDAARPAYDLIFADPPYRMEHTAEIPDIVMAKGLLAQSGFLLIEHAADLRFVSNTRYQVGPEKKFGRTIVTFFRTPPQHEGRT